jgi:hypothetical protein
VFLFILMMICELRIGRLSMKLKLIMLLPEIVLLAFRGLKMKEEDAIVKLPDDLPAPAAEQIH